MKKLNILGDTIVEVMLVLVIVGAVMGSAYVITNFSLQTELIAQQRSEALNIAQNQLEQLKNLVFQNPNIINQATSSLPKTFCVENNTITLSDGQNCVFDGQGNLFFSGSNSTAYTVAIHQQSNSNSWNKVVIIVSWPGRNSKENNDVYIFYAFT